MMDVLVAAMLTLACAVGWFGVIRLTRTVRLTSLTAAANWSIWFQATLTVTTIATLFKSRVSPGILDQLWYLTAVSALCPFVAVLGARRGRLLEWSLFIVLPLIFVLDWPAFVQLVRCWNGQRLELETPTLVVYSLMLVMVIGNFLDTRFAIPALCWISTWGLCNWSLNSGTVANPIGRVAGQRFAIFFLHLFWLSVAFTMRRKPEKESFGWDRVWSDFQTRFGGYWASRLLHRINEVAQREKWPWRLTPNGMQPATLDAPHPGSPTVDPRVDQTFRWLLKPFVDPEWIDERLTASTDRAAGG